MNRSGLNWIYLALCTLSLGCYFAFTHSLRFLLSGWSYHKTLYRMAFPNGFEPGKLVEHLGNLPLANGEFAIVALFAASCLLSGWLVWMLLGRTLDLLPSLLLLFSLAAAIIPTLLAAMVLWPDGRGMLTSNVLLGLGLLVNLVLGVFVFLHPPGPATAVRDSSWPSPLALLFAIPAAVVFLFTFLLGSRSIQGYDALAYHLPLAASWHARGSITTGYDIQYFLPGNAELVMRWMFLNGSDALVFLVPWFTALACLFMLYRIGLAMHFSKTTAICIACCAITFPVITFLSTVGYTDPFSVLFVLLAVFFFLRWRDSGLADRKALFACGLALGLGAGTKMSMLPPALAITLAAGWLILRHPGFWSRDPKETHLVQWNRSLIFDNARVFLPALLPGCAYWFLRNLVRFGNPFYPVSIFGLPGYPASAILPVDAAFRDNTLARIIYPWQELAYGSPYDDGMGAIFAGIAIPSLVFWWLLTRRKDSGVVYFLIVSALLMFATSNTTTPRYGIFAFLLSFLLVGELWTTTRSVVLRVLTGIAFLVPVFILIQSLGGGIIFQHLRGKLDGAERFGLPAVIDRAPAGRILNVAGAFYTYGLTGKDGRHDVVTLFRRAEPDDIVGFHTDYALVQQARLPEFTTRYHLEKLGEKDGIVLFRVLR